MSRVSLAAAALIAAMAHVAARQATFRSAVDVVSVPVSVTEKNKPVANLAAADFELLDNGVRQEISLSAIDLLPTDVTLVIDTSGSVSGKALERIKRDAQEMAGLLQPNDRVRVVSFARDATDLFGLIAGGATLDVSAMRTGGTTSLYDTLVTVLAAYPTTDRPHMVFVLSDGRDNSSFVSASHVVDVAKASSAVLCVALVQSSNPLVREGSLEAVDPMSEQSTVLMRGAAAAAPPPGVHVMGHSDIGATIAITRTAGPYAGGPNVAALRDAATATGGLVYTDATRTPIPQLFRRILDDFRASYVLTYSPAGVDRAGTHALTVRMKNKAYTIRARRTYEQR
jgi:VWFA-related protein